MYHQLGYTVPVRVHYSDSFSEIRLIRKRPRAERVLHRGITIIGVIGAIREERGNRDTLFFIVK